jgi:hypothetical protein
MKDTLLVTFVMSAYVIALILIDVYMVSPLLQPQ